MENGIFNRRNVISICVVAAVIVILTIVFLSRSNTGDEHIDDRRTELSMKICRIKELAQNR